MAVPTFDELLERYHALNSQEQVILRLLSVLYEAANQTTLNTILDAMPGLVSEDTRIDQYLKHKLEHLGLIVLQQGKLQCPPVLLGGLTHDAVLQGEFDQMLTASLKFLPLIPEQYGYYRNNPDNDKRKLHYALHQGNTAEFLALLGVDDPFAEPDSSAESNLLEVCANPLHSELFQHWHPAIQYQVLRPILQAGLITWSDNTSFFELLQKMAEKVDCPPQVITLYAEQCLVRGDWNTLAGCLDRLGANGEELSACANFVRSQGQPVKDFTSVLARVRRETRKRRIGISGLPGIIYLLALLKDRQLENSDLAQQQITALEKRKEPDIFSGAMWQLRLARETYEGRQTFSPAAHLSHKYVDPLTLLLIGLLHHWNSIEPGESLLTQLKVNSKSALDAGFRWFAHESEYLVAELEGTLVTEDAHWGEPLTRVLAKQEEWERSLQALINVRSDDIPIATDDTRIVWLIEDHDFGFYVLKPKEQKRKKNGAWTAGRAVSLKRFVEDPETLHLTDADLQICQAIKVSRSYGYYNSKYSYDLEGAGALLAAVEHPNLYRFQNQPVSLAEGEPELTVEEFGQDIRLAISPFPDGEEVLVIEESPEKLKVYQFSPELLEVARILTSKGLQVPQQAKQKVLESVSRIAPLLTIHSNIEGMSETMAEQVQADPRLYIHLRPQDSGMRVGFFVQPFGDGPLLKPGHGGERLFAEINNTPLTTIRDLDDEKSRFDTVVAACPAIYEASPEDWRWESTEEALEGLLTLKSFGEDLVLLWPEGKEFKLSRPMGVGNMSVSLRAKTDWFEVEGELQADENQVYSMQAVLELMNNSNGRFIELADGEFLTLTETLRQRLELMRNIEHQGKIHALGVQSMESAIDGMSVLADDGWHQLVNRLQDARDIDPELPTTVEADLRDYQLQGYKWLRRLAEWGAGACLADDMGLGKTLQALSLLVSRAPEGPAIVLAPTSVCANWLDEGSRFTPTLNPIRFGEGDRKGMLAALGPYDVLVCSYGLLQTESEALTDIQWHTIVADEAQAFKNSATKRSRAVMGLQGDFRMIATGTPIENHLGELWNLFNFINPGLLGNRETFNNKFAYPIENQKDREASSALRNLIRPFILRRLKRDVLTELPPLTEITIHVDLSEQETALYEALRIEAIDQIDKKDLKPNEQRIQALASITRLRRAVCNPNMVVKGSRLPSAKLNSFAAIVEELIGNQHRALVFSQFVDHLSLIRAYLDEQGITYRYLDGSTSTKKRQVEIESFQAGAADLFLISLKAGGVGLNLTAADYVIHMDPWWNPAVEDQASDRAHRIGQLRPVTVYRLVATGTIEEKIVDLHAHKRDLADSLLEGTEVSARMSVDDMLALLDQ